MLFTSVKAIWLMSVLVGVAGLGCRGDGGYGSSGCNSCRSGSIPADLQAANEDPADRQLSTPLGAATRLETSSSPALAQRTCPVTGAELGSMGPPVPVSVADRTIRVCCGGCREKVLRDPETYLARVDREFGGER